MQMTAHRKERSVLFLKVLQRYILFAVTLLLSTLSFSQNLTLTLKKATLEKAFREVESNIPQRFVYTREMLEKSTPVSINVKNAPLQKVLELIFEDQPLEFVLDDKFIKVRFRTASVVLNNINVQGRIVNDQNEPLSKVSISIKGKEHTVISDDMGYFILTNVFENDVLVISSIGYVTKEIPIKGRTSIEVELSYSVNELDRTIVMAYGSTTKRLNTGNIVKITEAEISKQPVANPLAALQGRVPGLTVIQGSGVHGAYFKVELRGRSSISQGTEPLFIIDGVPFAPNNNNISQIINASNVPLDPSSGGLSPLNLINPADIESIEILKDADATAIYGSRGANGVILITKKVERLSLM
jgi:TonB-dependent starch-binding outer membrane protein SusC